MLERFLDELGRELVKSHAPDDVRARLIEAELHLAEGVEARLELGLSVADAQREALEAFGQPVALVKAERPSVRPRLALLAIGYALFVLMFFAAWSAVSPASVAVVVSTILLLWATLAIAFAVLAFRSRRPAPFPLLATGCVASLVVAMSLGATTVPRRNAGLLPRTKAFAARRTLSTRLARREGEGARLLQDVDRLDRADGLDSFRVRNGFHVPIPASAQGWGPQLTYHDVAAEARAKDDVRSAWRMNAAEVRQLRDGLVELDDGMAHPIQSLMATAPEAATYGVVAACGVTLVDLLFGVCGALFARRRALRGPLGA